MTATPGESTPEERLAALGFQLPDKASPLALYQPAVRVGDLVFTAGTIAIRNGEILSAGHAGAPLQPGERLVLR